MQHDRRIMEFQTVNELALQIHSTGNEIVYTKAGAFITGKAFGGRNYKFEKILLGPQGNAMQAVAGQILRRFTGENLPLMKVSFFGESLTYYANEQQHVVLIPLQPGETLCVESENILAFTQDCAYSVRFLAQGVISQKGLATSVLKGNGPNAMVAVLSDGNPLILNNQQDGSSLTADPDAIICWTGADPMPKLDLSWKNIIGQASGESYMFQWDAPATIIVQPNERKSGVDISMDGKRTGQQAHRQQNQSMTDVAGQMGDILSGVGGALGGTGGGRRGGGLSGVINNLLN